MSSLNARTRHAEPVYLNIYDLSPMNDYIYDIGFGFYHSGVQVHGDEWTFSTSGVFYHRPQQAPNVKFRTQVLLGTVNYTSSKVKDIINSLRDDFQGERYHLLNNWINQPTLIFLKCLILYSQILVNYIKNFFVFCLYSKIY